MFAKVTPSQDTFAPDPKACAAGAGQPEPIDLRCQGYKSDLCGCLNVPEVSSKPYFGCVMAGFGDTSDQLKLVTLPGVVDLSVRDSLAGACVDKSRALQAAEPCATPRCCLAANCRCGTSHERHLSLEARLCIAAVPLTARPRAGIWSQVQDVATSKCLTVTSVTSATTDDCAPSGDTTSAVAVSQQFRVVAFQKENWEAVEALAFPGLCIVLNSSNTPQVVCSCADLALLVRIGSS
jgi:hypothetical protein